MRQVSVDKYNVAWFKLAEFVARGEKERALCVYRLLSHSIDDQAFVAQLEGDILLSFNDTNSAINRYQKAVDLYKKDGNILQAAAVYEHLLTLKPDMMHYRNNIVALYKELPLWPKVKQHAQPLLKQYVHKKEIGKAIDLLRDLDAHVAGHLCTLFVSLLFDASFSRDTMQEYIKKTVNSLSQCDTDTSLQQFIMALKKADKDYHIYAQECLKK